LGKSFPTAAAFLADLEALKFGAWRPRFVTHHQIANGTQKTLPCRSAHESVIGWLTSGYDGFRRLARCWTGGEGLCQAFIFDADRCNVCGGSLAKISDPKVALAWSSSGNWVDESKTENRYDKNREC
jgi:hypothetical protein